MNTAHDSILDAIAELKRRRAALKARSSDALERALDDVLVEAVRLSSGTKTPRQLKAEDHPYASRHGALGKFGDEVGASGTNQRRGAFRRGWEKKVVVGPDGRRVVRLSNSALTASGENLGDVLTGDPSVSPSPSRLMIQLPLSKVLSKVARKALDERASAIPDGQ